MLNYSASSFGALLKTLRQRARLTQQQLAEAIGMHRHAVSRWEQGEVLPASKAIVLELARRLRLNDQEARQLLEASLTAPAPLWAVPFHRNLFFTGREQTLEALHQHLSAQRAVALIQSYALHGLGGVGKTQTALEYAYRHALEYSAIFWIEAETIERVQSSVQRIAQVLQLPERAATNQHQIVEAVQRWLATHQGWLLIWDNLEDLELPAHILPPTWQGALLFTTRRQALGTLARGIDLQPMEQEVGVLLLLRRARLLSPEAPAEQIRQLVADRPAEYAAASQLVTLLGGLPLALDQAGAYLEETGCSLSDYLQRYGQQEAYLLSRRGNPGGDHPHSVTTTFRLSQERVEQEQEVALDLLRLCAFLHPESIPEELFVAGSAQLGPSLAAVVGNPTEFDLALAALRTLSLVQRQAQTHTISLHRLVQVVMREQMEPDEVRLWSERVIHMVNAAFPNGDFATWTQCERYLAQALACVPLLAATARELVAAGELFFKAGRYLVKRGRFEEAEPLLAQAVTLQEQHYGPDHPALIPGLILQGELFWKQGKFACAEALNLRALTIEERHPESPSSQVGEILNNLGLLSWEQGKYAQAEPLYQRSLQMREACFGPDDLEIASIVNNLALLYWKQGRYTQAEPLYQRTLQIRKQELGLQHPDTIFLHSNLAILYRDQGKYEQARSLFQQTLQAQEQLLGPQHPDVASTLVNLAILYLDQGRDEQAEPLVQRSLDIRERVFGPKHVVVARSLYNLAILYLDQGRHEQAEAILQQALDIQKQELGPNHRDVGRSLSGLATLYMRQSNYAQAELLFEQDLQIREQDLGPEHPEVAFPLTSLANLYTERGNYERAEALYQRALCIREQRLDACHLAIARNLAALANLYKVQGREQSATPLLRRAYSIFEQHLGVEHPETVQTRNRYLAVIEQKSR